MAKKEFRQQPLQVSAKNDETIDRLIKRFTKKVRNEGVIEEIFERRHYKKPSIRRREKAHRARFNKMLDEKK